MSNNNGPMSNNKGPMLFDNEPMSDDKGLFPKKRRLLPSIIKNASVRKPEELQGRKRRCVEGGIHLAKPFGRIG